jgi:hypothetical protein
MTYTHRKTVLRYWRHKCFRNTAEGEVVEDSEGFVRCASCHVSVPVSQLSHGEQGFVNEKFNGYDGGDN